MERFAIVHVLELEDSVSGSVEGLEGRFARTQLDSRDLGVSHQIRFWGLAASYAFIEQPQTNGVAERFLKTLKEQIIYGRIYRTVAELREAVEAFVDLYNEQWLPEKNGFLNPSVTREAWCARQAQGVAA